MTAFDTGRRMRVYGTEGVLEGSTGATDGEAWIAVRPHEGVTKSVEIMEPDTGGYQGHGGGDFCLIAALPKLLDGGAFNDFIEGHRIGFAAAQAVRDNCVICLGG